ncbi:MAG: glycine zipper domain-containing protein [Daejeonella sp.]|uniref:YMGG-like glycine zipper-containing protein n=1 Tax=Daejeonella sp. TaxID=2805397 RepID=UPI002735A775|nr:YMGG-like glycine zipper-containing protein [Daejeonella sp.]MDP3469120.1 glycine zipper domain-containing protein [Daejeonella sp.]
MKNILILFAFAVIVTGCSTNANENARISQDSIRMVHELDSFKRAASADSAATALAIAKDRANTNNKYQSSKSVTTTNTTTQTGTASQKKGWSSAAKGAVIGGVIGAGTGIIVDKKDGRGAAIGGAVGAGTGYVIGREQDKKSGRVQQ